MTFVPAPMPDAWECGAMYSDTDRIAVGVDGSENSLEALRYAARMARALDAPLEAITVWSYPPITGAVFGVAWSPADDAKKILARAVDTVFGHEKPARFTTSVLPGPAAKTLIDLSETCGMLVLGSRGVGGFTGLVLGSVVAACAAHAHCPVLVVHQHPEPAVATEGTEHET